MFKPIRLVVNTQPYYGGIELVSEHKTWIDAVIAGVKYRKENPTANTLEIYDHNEPSHSIENFAAWNWIVERHRQHQQMLSQQETRQ